MAMYNNQLALLPAMETEGLELDLLVEDPYSEAAGGDPEAALLAAFCEGVPLRSHRARFAGRAA